MVTNNISTCLKAGIALGTGGTGEVGDKTATYAARRLPKVLFIVFVLAPPSG